ncbi:MAG TPA: TonB family protein [Kofleriaceae bacterium]|nr:TonB family protein [Kofleriaceae bacterium]
MASIWAATLAIHGLALLWFAWHLERRTPASPDLLADDPAADSATAVPSEAVLIDVSDLASVALVDESSLGPLLEPRTGPADQSGSGDSHPFPSAGIDLPGVRPAARGGGAETAGADSFTGRRDPDTLRVQFWTDPSRYQVAHRRTGDARSSASPEWLARREESGHGDREPRRRARDGAPLPVAGTAGATGTGGVNAESDRAWRDADPRFDGGRAPLLAQQIPGAARAGQRPMVDTGQRAAEAERIGALRDPVDAAPASNARTTGPLELSRPSSGGRAQEGGVDRPRDAAGPLASSPHRGAGTAASSAQLPVGGGRESLRAARTDPYFRRFYEKLDREIVFPRELALALEQGEVVVTFSLSVHDGAVGQLTVVKSSGFAAFDNELRRALVAVGPLGPVPRALRGRSDRLRVTAPYAFKSPLVR